MAPYTKLAVAPVGSAHSEAVPRTVFLGVPDAPDNALIPRWARGRREKVSGGRAVRSHHRSGVPADGDLQTDHRTDSTCPAMGYAVARVRRSSRSDGVRPPPRNGKDTGGMAVWLGSSTGLPEAELAIPLTATSLKVG